MMQKFPDRLAHLLVSCHAWLFAAVIVLALGAAFFIKDIRINNALENWFVEKDPTLLAYNEYKRTYGNDEVVMIWIKSQHGIYDQAFIKSIYDLSNNLERHALVSRVTSITKASSVSLKDDTLQVEQMVNAEPDENFDLAAFRSRLEANRSLKKILLNKDESATVVIVEPRYPNPEEDRRPELVGFVKAQCKGFHYKLAGVGVIDTELNRLTMNDSILLTSLTYLTLLLAIYIFYRKRVVVFAATATIILLTVLFLGIMGACNQKFNVVSSILPILILIMCLEDIVFIYSHYYDTPVHERDIKTTLSHVMVPCFFTSLTTAIGFFASCTSPMTITRNFGIFAALGVLLEFVVSVIVGTFFLVKWQGKETLQHQNQEPAARSYETLFQPSLKWIYSKVAVHYRLILGISAAAMVIGLFGITRVTVDTNGMDMLKRTDSVRQDSHFLERDYGFYLPMEIRLQPTSGTIKDPDFLKRLSLAQDRLEQDPSFAKPFSVADIVKQLNQVLTDNQPGSYRIPDTRQAIAQELLLYEMDADKDLFSLVDRDFSEARLTVHVPMSSSRSFEALIAKIRQVLEGAFEGNARIIPSGYGPLYVKTVDYISQTQITSFILAFVLIFLSTTILLKSKYYLFIIIIPNIIPVICTLGFMGYAHINLDIATVTVAAITIGLSVDNTIHYLYLYKLKRTQGLAVNEAVREALLFKGAPMFISDAILICGFFILVFGQTMPIINFGFLISMTLAIALCCDLFLLPALLIFFSGLRAKRHATE